MNKTLKKVVFGLIILAGLLMLPTNGAMAADKNKIASKAVFEGVWQCVSGGAVNTDSFMASKLNSNFVVNSLGGDTVKLPYNWTDVSDNNMNCKELFMSYNNSNSGLKGGLIPSNIRNGSVTDVAKFFAGDTLNGNGGLGYKAEADNADTTGTGQKLSFTMNTDADSARACGAGNIVTPSINGASSIVFPTLIKNADGGVVASNTESYNVPTPGSGGITRFDTTCGIGIDIEDTGSSDRVAYTIYIDGQYYAVIQASDSGSQAAYTGSFNWNYMNAQGNGIYLTGAAEEASGTSLDSYVSDYTLTWNNNVSAFYTGLSRKNTTGYSMSSNAVFYDDFALSRQEVFDLYKYYIKDVFGANVACEGDSNYEAYESAGLPTISWSSCGTCRVDVNGASNPNPGNVYGVKTSDYHFTETVSSVQDAVDVINSLGDVSDLTTGGSCETNNGNSSSGEKNNNSTNSVSGYDSEIVDCNQIDDIGAMQWILCPAMNNSQYTASWVDDLAKKYLEVNTTLYDNNSGTKTVWEVIRNIANVLMIVLLLVVIFSQLTGYGIDNYGIKKMLPRLIMMAILINLSFYICQLAIDLSNIAGVGLRNMFGSIGGDSGATTGTGFLSSMIVGVFSAAATGGTAAVTAGTTAVTLGVVAPVAIVIGVLVLLFMIIVAVATLVIMLGAREVIIIACIIMAPLAFAAFILPNTQSLFKKWWGLFKAAIIIFPICGTLSGISYMLRSLAMNGGEYSAGGFAILMILPYLGFFLLPMLLKGAISALGKVGGALTSLGGRLREGAQTIGRSGLRLAQDSEAYKNRKADVERQRQERNAQRAVDRIRQKEANGRSVSAAERKRLYDAQTLLNKMRMEDEMAEQGAVVPSDDVVKARATSLREAQELKNYSDQYANLTRAEMGTELTNAIVAYNNDRSDANALRLQAVLISAEDKGMNKEMLAGLGDVKFDSANANDAKVLSRLAGSSDKVLSQYGIQMSKLAAPDYKHADVDANGNRTERSLTDDERNISLGDFIGSQAEVKLSKVSSDKGPSWLNTVNDDTWEAILRRNPDAIDTHTLITVATNTTDGKVLAKVNEIFADRKRRGVQENYSMSASELAKLKPSTVSALEGTGVYNNAVAGILSNPNSSANQQILNTMEDSVKDTLGLDNASIERERRTPGYSYMRSMSNSSTSDLVSALQSGKLTRSMAHTMLTSDDQNIRNNVDGNAEMRRILEAGASGMMPTTSNPTPISGGAQLNWTESTDIDRAARNYREQSNNMQGDYVVRDAEQVRAEAEAENAARIRQTEQEQARQRQDELIGTMRDLTDAVRNNDRPDNNGGPDFTGGAGI